MDSEKPEARRRSFLPQNTSLSALIRSRRAPNASESASAQPPSPRPGPSRPSTWKHVALALGVAGSVVFAFAQRDKARGELTPSVRHGSAGVKYTSTGADVRWRTRRTKVVIDDSVEKLGPAAVSAVQGAFGTWLSSNPKLPELSFDTTRDARLETRPDGKNTVLVAPIRIKGHEHDLAVTLTYSDEVTGAIVEADIVINSEHAFRVFGRDDDDNHDDDNHDGDRDGDRDGDNDGDQTDTSGERRSCMAGEGSVKTCGDGAYDLQNIVTHEVGHFLGLGEDMSDNGATMFYCTSRCETHKRVLSTADSGTISTLYLAADQDDDAAASAAGCGARLTPKGNLGEAALALSAVLVLFTRRRRHI